MTLCMRSYPKMYRCNTRLITVDDSLTGVAWQRLQPVVPATVQLQGDMWDAVGLNNHWRLAKYVAGDRFQAHCDAAYAASPDLVRVAVATIIERAATTTLPLHHH
jgi:hypothetical protein